LFDATWVALVEADGAEIVAVSGGIDLPSREWLSAFIIGTRSGEGSFAAVDELARVEVPGSRCEVLVSRAHIPLRRAELDLLVGLAGMGAVRLAQLAAEVS
jgi:hypothetical protein